MLFHYDPDHDDAFVDGLVEKARREFPNVFGAAEGMEIDLPGRHIEPVGLATISDRRQEHRYRLELPVRLVSRGPGGESVETLGLTQEISKSGAYFIVPREFRTNKPVELEMTLPDEITQRGDLSCRFIAQPVRQEHVKGPLRSNRLSLGVAAHLAVAEKSSSPAGSATAKGGAQ
jgi:hypothetical protein